jgi:hypothetical protein
MLIDEFFNKSRFSVSKLSDQVEVKPDVLFSLPTFILDTISLAQATTVTAKLIKTTGRDITELPTVVTSTLLGNTCSFSATPALVDWDGKTSLSLKVTVDLTNIVLVLLVNKG